MRWCPNCRRISEGSPNRCQYCGSTWGRRLCRAGHSNPPDARFCGQCGSARLSDTCSGGGFVNFLLQLPLMFRSLIRIVLWVLPVLLFLSIIADYRAFLTLLVSIVILFLILHLASISLPGWITKPVKAGLAYLRKAKDSRTLQRESRE